MPFKVQFEFTGLCLLNVTGEGKDRKLEVLVLDKGKNDLRHTPRVLIPVENIANIPSLLIDRKEMNLGLDVLVGPSGQYFCHVDLMGKTLTLPTEGGVTSDPDPIPAADGGLPKPLSRDQWRPLAYLPNVRTMVPEGSTVEPAGAVARVNARGGFLYAAPAPRDLDSYRLWEIRHGAETRRQFLADRAVLEVAVGDSTLSVRLEDRRLPGKSANLVLQPPPGDREADVPVAISSHCCLSNRSTPEGLPGPPIEDLEAYSALVSNRPDLSRAAFQLPFNTTLTVGVPRCPSALWR